MRKILFLLEFMDEKKAPGRFCAGAFFIELF
jgi:hypothetical protein